MKKTIKNPHWINNARTVLSAEFHYEDGRVMHATVTDTTNGNPDWVQIQRDFTSDEIEQNTLRAMQKQAQKQEDEKAKALADEIRKKNELLFDAKMAAFEVDIIKDSQDRATKSKIRKAKSVFEVYAFASKLILEADTSKEQQ